jgi:hypothetical protein
LRYYGGMLFKAWENLRKVRPVDAGPVAMATANRRFFRSLVQTPARLNLAGNIREVRLLDISLQGALVEAPSGMWGAIGTRGRLRLTLMPATFIAMDVAVARTQGHCLGLRCVNIDLDSITHLRQLVARNSDDPLLLGRELSRLIGSS